MKTAVVIQAGGTGTRLWPLSTKKNPKQFARLIEGKSLLRNTFERLAKQYCNQDIFITSNILFKDQILQEIPEISEENLILEPHKMDTSAAIGLTAFKMEMLKYDTVICISCDHNIINISEFLKVLKISEEIAIKYPNNLVLIGMNPNYPATGFGYIEMGEPVDRFQGEIVFKVNSFKEKPDKSTAEQFINDWRYLWNAGYFIFNPKFLLKKYNEIANKTFLALKSCYTLDPNDKKFNENYLQCEAISFDYAIVEKLNEILVIPANVGWSDIGSWKTVHEILTNNRPRENVSIGQTKVIDSEGVMIYSTDDKLIAVLGLKNLIVINTKKVLLITNQDNSENVKKLVSEIDEELK